MPPTFESLGLGGLTDDQKLAFIGRLWDELVASSPPRSLLTDAQLTELRRRDADSVANPDDWVAWNEESCR
jgi:hypothetical protein